MYSFFVSLYFPVWFSVHPRLPLSPYIYPLSSLSLSPPSPHFSLYICCNNAIDEIEYRDINFAGFDIRVGTEILIWRVYWLVVEWRHSDDIS